MCSSPQLIAACHVLRRLLMPRHSPCALISLTSSSRASTTLHFRRRPLASGENCAPFRRSSSPTPTRLRWARRWENAVDGVCSRLLVLVLRIMQAISQKLYKIAFTLILLEFPHFYCFSVALLFYCHCSVFKVQVNLHT